MKIAKRYLALVLSFALFLALPLAFTQEAAAASKGTKILQPATVVSTSSNSSGYSSTDINAFAYNEKGLNNLIVDENGYQTAMVYNKSGYMTTSARLDKNGTPFSQTIYDVKKGKVKSYSSYYIDGGKVTLSSFTKNTYKSGKLSQMVNMSPNGSSRVTTFRKDGTCSKSVFTSQFTQTVSVYDKHGNITSFTEVYKNGDYSTTELVTYKNTYKDGKLVKTAWTSAETSSYSNTPYVTTGLNVYTYKKGKLVKADEATSYPADAYDPAETYGTTYTYAYTKGGLIKSEATTSVRVTATESTVIRVSTTAYQYKKVAVNKKCVDAVKKAMEEYSYESYIPGVRA